MDEKDFNRIEQMLMKVVDAKLEKIPAGFDTRLERFKDEIVKEFGHQLSIQTEEFQHRLEIVAEGHQMLSDKLDRVGDGLSRKIDAVSADLAAHRADTEAHHGVYRVKEGND